MPVRYLEDVTPELVNHFISERIRADGIAPKTANRIRELLHVMFSYAIKQHGFVSPIRGTRNPMENVDRRPEPAPKIRFLELEEIAKQLKLLNKQPVLRTAVAILIYAGLRREECLWLTKDDIDLAQRIIRVRAKTEGGEFWQPKTKRNRAVPISNALLAILKEYRPKKGCVWFIPSPEGKRWDPDNFSHALSDVNLKAGVKCGALIFRHTFGSQLAMKGESLYKISELMGNSPEICRRHYAALIPEKMRDTVEFDVPADSKTAALRSHQMRKHREARGRRGFAIVKANVG
jgi:integrase